MNTKPICCTNIITLTAEGDSTWLFSLSMTYWTNMWRQQNMGVSGKSELLMWQTDWMTAVDLMYGIDSPEAKPLQLCSPIEISFMSYFAREAECYGYKAFNWNSEESDSNLYRKFIWLFSRHVIHQHEVLHHVWLSDTSFFFPQSIFCNYIVKLLSPILSEQYLVWHKLNASL